eukprot:5556608-Alexandrium_andersonii.AAC.1
MTVPAPPALSNWTDGPASSKATATSGQPSPPDATCGAASESSSRPARAASAATKLAAHHRRQEHQPTAHRQFGLR